MQARFAIALAMALIPILVMGCGSGDEPDEKTVKPVSGTFAGKVPKSDAFVSVAAEPAAKGQKRRAVAVFVCDAKRLCEWFSGAAAGNDFVARSDDRKAEATGKLTDKAVAGTIKLPGGKTLRYKAGQATATAGLYDLKVASNGKLTGASEAGVGVKGKSSLPKAGTGELKLADGRRLKFAVAKSSDGSALRLGSGQARVIVLADGKLAGAATGSGESAYFLRSAAN